MNIPREAHEAAADAYVGAIANRLIPSRQAAPIMLEAAAPIIAAQALREFADEQDIPDEQWEELAPGLRLALEGRRFFCMKARLRADELDPQ